MHHRATRGPWTIPTRRADDGDAGVAGGGGAQPASRVQPASTAHRSSPQPSRTAPSHLPPAVPWPSRSPWGMTAPTAADAAEGEGGGDAVQAGTRDSINDPRR